MIHIVSKYKKQLIYCCIVFYTFIFVTWMSYSDNPFLQDDNGLQWNPVIETAFREFFSTGHIPQYNFYQLKGYDIFQTGYYGLYNPLMYLAYVFSLIFRTNPLCAYTYISFMMGNFIVYWLGRKNGCHEIWSLMIMFLYSTSGVFFYYSYWYYSMENYWMIPLMFLLFLRDDNTNKAWYQYGLWMAFSVYLGNIQFTMYHWMLCEITLLTLWLSGRKGYWKKIGTNTLAALTFSVFPIIGLWRAAAQSEIYSGRNADFMACPVKFMEYLDETIFGTRGVNLLLMGVFGVGAYYLLQQIKKNKNISYHAGVMLSSLVSFVFFILFMGGEEYLLAKVLYQIPGLSGCRYLEKILLVLPGCILPLAMYAFHQMFMESGKGRTKRILIGYLLVLSCFSIGIKHSGEAYQEPFQGEYGKKAALDVKGDLYNMNYPDCNNYRTVNLISGKGYDDDSAYYTETHNVDSLLLGNLGTKLSVFSLGGYDSTFHKDSLESTVSLYRENPSHWSSSMESEMFSVRNTISITTLMRNICRQEDNDELVTETVKERYPGYELLQAEYQYDDFDICRNVILSLQKDGVVSQISVQPEELGVVRKSAEVFDVLSQNGVKYMFYDQGIWTDVEQLLREFDAMNIRYTLGSVRDNCRYIELWNDIVPIASNQDAQALSMITDMDKLQISVAENDTQCNISMTYNDKLKARYYQNWDSKGVELKVGSDKNHNIVIDLKDCKNGCIVITYENSLNLLCIVQMVLLLMAMIIPTVLQYKAIFVDCIHKIGAEQLANICVGVLIIIYVVYILRVYLHTEALVPDERWFLNVLEMVNVHSLREYLTLPNHLCYGPIYWLFMSKLGTFVNMRILCGMMLLSVIPAIVLSVLSQNPKTKASACFPAVILCLTAPLSWFTGKIIGPEIMGYCLGVWGCTIGMCAVAKGCRAKKAVFFIAGLLIGISFGIKLNYIVFGVFLGIYTILSLGRNGFREMVVDAVCLMVGATAGFICSSPICLTDFETYLSNFERFIYSPVYLKEVVFKDYIEWDFVNSGGLNHTIISFAAFVCFFLLGIKECFIKKEKKTAVFIAGYSSILMLFLLCSKERFLGWYLLPVIYFVCINLSSRRLTYIILMINLLLTVPDIYFQIYAKEAHIRYVEQKDTIMELVNHYTEQFSDYTKYTFVDNEIGNLPLDIVVFYSNVDDEKEILFLSDKSLYNDQLNEIYHNALYQKNGYRFIAHRNDIHVILYERGT